IHFFLHHLCLQSFPTRRSSDLLAVLGGVLPQTTVGQLARLGISFGAQSVFLKYSRDAEREADLLGSQTMYDAGFDPYSMAEFFRSEVHTSELKSREDIVCRVLL